MIHVVDCVKLMAIFALTRCGLIICHSVCASLIYLVVVLPITIVVIIIVVVILDLFLTAVQTFNPREGPDMVVILIILDLFLTAVRTFTPREGPDAVVIRPLVVRVAFIAVTPLTMFWANGLQRPIIWNIVVLATYLAETGSLASQCSLP